MTIIKSFSDDELKIIEEGIKNKLNNSEIARLINRPKSSIKNEINKVVPIREQYTFEAAKKYRQEAKIRQGSKRTNLLPENVKDIQEKILDGYSVQFIRRIYKISYKKYHEILLNIPIEELNKRKKKNICERVNGIELQLTIIFEILKDMKNGKN